MVANWTVLASGLKFPEGPVFALDGRLWWVEIEGGDLGWRLASGERGRVVTGGRPNGAAVGRDRRIWFCDQGQCSIRALDVASGAIETVVACVDGHALGKPNDLAFDRAGNLVFTCPNDARTEPAGYVCCLTRNRVVKRIAEALFFPNGLAFLPDGRLVIAETYRHRLWIGAWDVEEAAWTDPRPWVEVGGPVGPDGMAVGPDGRLYVAVFGQGRIGCIDLSGHVLYGLQTPGMRPTNCCFDPARSGRLIVTEAERGELLAADVFQ